MSDVELTTEATEEATITTVADELNKEGIKDRITTDQGRQIAMQHHTTALMVFEGAKQRDSLSKKELWRLVLGMLQLPDLESGKMPVLFKTNEAKGLFDIAQKGLAGKYSILYDYVMMRARIEKEAAQVAKEQVETTEEKKEE